MGWSLRFKNRHGLPALSTALAIAVVTMMPMAITTGGPAGAVAARGTSLRFGILGTNSGSSDIGQEGEAFQAYVANWNAHGGYKGHPIQISSEDGALDPTMTEAAARTLINSDHVIGIALDYAFLDCLVNKPYYATTDVPRVGGGNPSCIPANSDGLSILVKYAAEKGAKKVAFLGPTSVPELGAIPGYTAPVLKSFPHTKIVPTMVNLAATPTAADIDTVIVSLKAQGVDAVYSFAQAGGAALEIQEANRQGFGPKQGIRWMFGPTLYTPSAASAIPGADVLDLSYPWYTNSPQVRAAYKILKRAKVSPLDGFAAVGYQQASVFQQILDSIKGPVTSASFGRALQHTTHALLPLSNGLRYNAWNTTHNAFGGVVIQATNGKFTTVSPFIISKY